MIYQGIHSGELDKLETKDIDLEAGKIYIQGTERSNERTLQLEANQLIPIQNYLQQIRPMLLQQIDKETTRLLVNTGNCTNTKNTTSDLFRKLKKQYPYLTDRKQIRASVITNWLKKEHLREVQYKAGHKYVSSTEKYDTTALETLLEELENYHPLK